MSPTFESVIQIIANSTAKSRLAATPTRVWSSMPLVRASEPPHPSSSQGDPGSRSTDTPGSPNPNPTTSIPIVRLDVDVISDVLAAGLAVALVGHVLFLKSQVPLCVGRLFFSFP